MTILATSLTLAVSRAHVPADAKVHVNYRLDKPAQFMKASDEPQKIVLPNSNKVDREKEPLLVAPHCPNCRNSDSIWNEIRLRLTRFFLI